MEPRKVETIQSKKNPKKSGLRVKKAEKSEAKKANKQELKTKTSLPPNLPYGQDVVVKITFYTFTLFVDDKQIELKVKSPDIESYNNLKYNVQSFDVQKQFLLENTIEPSREELNKLIAEYPGIVDSFVNACGRTFFQHIRRLNKRVEQQWKKSEKELGNSALDLLEFLGKPKNEANEVIALLLLDGLACLRHLRMAYSKGK